MLILSHRGLWTDPLEKNAMVAFDRTVAMGFGTETDVRDYKGDLVISHDPPIKVPLLLGPVLDLFEGRGLTLAINIKSDGLAPALLNTMAQRAISWFAFDMSAPETIRFAHLGVPFFTRQSDYEPEPICYAKARGVWLDAFDTEWYNRDHVMRHIEAGKQLCIVSPDLHGRSVEPLWSRIADWEIQKQPNVMLCTDLPGEARAFFKMETT